MNQTTGTTSAIVLPAELAPALAERLLRLLDQVSLARRPHARVPARHEDHRCVVCHRPGKLGGHHASDGGIQWIHAKCHRRLHRSGRHDVVLPAQRGSRYVC